jgi:glutaminase
VFSLTLALKILGKDLWERVGVEPSGNAFNSLVQLEYEQGIPRNPFINAGAIVICDILVTCLTQPKAELLGFIRSSSGIPTIDYSSKIADSEKQTGYRNYALTNLMKDFGNIQNDVETVLGLYFHLCSIEMTCKELAQAFLFLASDGVNPLTNATVVNPTRTKRINSIMQMCGFYDEAGEFAFSTGLPGKSGVGGGIVAIHPGKYSIAVWSPKLNTNGNSYKGMKVLEGFTTKTASSIF